LSLDAAGQLRRHRDQVSRLGPAIQKTIAATMAHGVLMAAGLAASRFV